jgi:hypothetical protein
VIDRKIRRAMEDGDFDNLPGHGKPLELDDDPLEDPTWRMARRMLKSNGFSHPAIEAKRAIEADIAKGPPAVGAEGWRADINRRIRDHNLRWSQAAMQLKPL